MDGKSKCFVVFHASSNQEFEEELFSCISNRKINEAKVLLKHMFEQMRNTKKSIDYVNASSTRDVSTRSVKVKSFFSNIELVNAAVRTRDLELVQLILKVGGRKLLFFESYESHGVEVNEEPPWAYQATGTDCYFPEGTMNQIEFVGYGPLHQACQLANHDLRSSILLDETGGKENNCESHDNCMQGDRIQTDSASALNATFNIIQYFVFIGGKELILQKTKDFTKQNSLHILCNHVRRKHLPSTLSSEQLHAQLASMQNMYKIMELLIQHGGKELILSD